MDGAVVIGGAAAATPPEPQAPRVSLADEAERVAARISDRLGPTPAARQEPADGPRGARGVAGAEAATADDAGGSSVGDAEVVPAADAGAVRGAEAAGVRGAGERSGARGAGALRRASAVAGESIRPRVERLREASAGVLDEAADDPGLRFVVVAAVLFVVFLLLWVFSYALG
jgi:hypothetical protein